MEIIEAIAEDQQANSMEMAIAEDQQKNSMKISEAIAEDQQENSMEITEVIAEIPNILDDNIVSFGVDYEPFVKATEDGDWSNMEKFIDSHHQALTAKVFPRGQTALHYVLDSGQTTLKIAASLVDRLRASDLEIQDRYGYTPLARAARKNSPDMFQLIKLMVEKNPKLANIGEPWTIPVVVASRRGYKDTTHFLYSKTDTSTLRNTRSRDQAELLINCIDKKMFDIASDLVEKIPKILIHGIYRYWDGGKRKLYYPIHAFAKTFSASARGGGHKKSSQFNRWLSSVREYIMGYVHHDRSGDKIDTSNKQLIHIDQAQARFLQLVGAEVSTFDNEMLRKVVYNAMIEAAICGNIEFIVEMLAANSELIYAEKEEKHMFLYAVEYRREKVFNLIYGITEKDFYLHRLNKGGKSMLYYAAIMPQLPALYRTSANPTLQIQREIKWFKEVWNLSPPDNREVENSEGLQPRQLFDKNHEKLIEAGEKVVRDTAQSYTVVGALIVTIMFTAAFTIPGGNNQTTGYPIFVSEALFKVFITCDALSLYSSTTSILVFLEILTSRYEEDFLLHLPKKIIIGLFTLFFSIATMMVTFCSALAIMLDDRLEFILPISLLAFFPVFLFLSSLSKIFSKIVKSMFGPSVFDKNTKLPTQRTYERKDKKVSGSAEGELVRNGEDGIV